MKTPESSRRMRRIVVGLKLIAAIMCAVAVFDMVRFERVCRRIITVTNELAGHAGSIGGWPIGREFELRFDAPLTDDAIRRLVAVDPKMRRIYLMLHFRCEIPDARLADMRAMVASHRGISVFVSPVTERENAREQR